MFDVYLQQRSSWILNKASLDQGIKLSDVFEDLTPYISYGFTSTTDYGTPGYKVRRKSCPSHASVCLPALSSHPQRRHSQLSGQDHTLARKEHAQHVQMAMAHMSVHAPT